MKADKKSTEIILIGSIVQVGPKAGHPAGIDGMIGIVAAKHSWGVSLAVQGIPGTAAVSYALLEPTGGRVVWSDGDRVEAVDPAPTNHP